MSEENPCRFCDERHYNCHAHCKRHKRFKENHPRHEPNVADAYWYERRRKIETKVLKKGHKYGSNKD